MEYIDMRKISTGEAKQIRRQIVRLKKMGRSGKEIEEIVGFMGRLIAKFQRKVFFIMDNLRVHHGKFVSAWLERHKSQIEVFFLPPYAPECNPDEYLNHGLKLSVHSGELSRLCLPGLYRYFVD